MTTMARHVLTRTLWRHGVCVVPLALMVAACSTDAPWPNETTGQAQEALTTLNIANAVGNDDGEEVATTMNRGSATLDLNYDGTGLNIVGVRFNGITVPQGATISSAYIQLLPTSSPNSGAPTVTIKAQASDNAPTLAGTASYMSTLATTTASVSWAPANFTASVADANSKTPELKTIIQEIVNRAGWVS